MQRRVLMLHGWGGSFQTTFADRGWHSALQSIGREAFGMDLPGHGLSPASTVPSFYDDLAGLVDRGLPDEPLDIVAYSLGAKIALELNARYPDRFERIVLAGIGDNAFAPEKAGDATIAVLEGADFDAAPPMAQSLVAYSRLSGGKPLAMAAVLRRAPNPVLTPQRLQDPKAKLLVVNGDADTLAMPDTALLQALGNPTKVLLEGANHFTLLDDEGLQTAATAFLTYPESAKTSAIQETQCREMPHD